MRCCLNNKKTTQLQLLKLYRQMRSNEWLTRDESREKLAKEESGRQSCVEIPKCWIACIVSSGLKQREPHSTVSRASVNSDLKPGNRMCWQPHLRGPWACPVEIQSGKKWMVPEVWSSDPHLELFGHWQVGSAEAGPASELFGHWLFPHRIKLSCMLCGRALARWR